VSSGYTFVGEDRRKKTFELFCEWLDLIDYLVGRVQVNWATKKVYAHFDPKGEKLCLMRTIGQATIERVGNNAWFKNQTGVKVADIEADREVYFSGVDFRGWKTCVTTKRKLDDALESLVETFIADSDKLFAATMAVNKLNDIADGLSDSDDLD
jgi:hypothetical protein